MLMRAMGGLLAPIFGRGAQRFVLNLFVDLIYAVIDPRIRLA